LTPNNFLHPLYIHYFNFYPFIFFINKKDYFLMTILHSQIIGKIVKKIISHIKELPFTNFIKKILKINKIIILFVWIEMYA